MVEPEETGETMPSDVGLDVTFCPDCGGSLTASEADSLSLICLGCGRTFDLSAEDADAASSLRGAGATADADHLNSLRIRQLAAARRAAYRARSYSVIATAACVVMTGQLAWMTFRHVHASGWGKQPIGYVLFALLAVLGIGYFTLRAAELHREAKKSALSDPVAPPDFSTLDDGSKRVRNLEDVR